MFGVLSPAARRAESTLPRLAALVLGVCLAAVHGARLAADDTIPWKTKTYALPATLPAPPDDLIRELAADSGISVVFSEKVATARPVSSPFEGTPQEVLERLTGRSGLIWYYDGFTLYIYRSDEIEAQIIQLQFARPEELLRNLNRVGLYSKRFPLKVLEEHNAIYVVGPLHYRDAIAKFVTLVDQAGAAQRQADLELDLRVFPLKYAWADDQTFFFGNTQVLVPGVATTLRSVLTGQQGPGGSSIRSIPLPNVLPKLKGQGLIGRFPREDVQAFAPGATVTPPELNRGAEGAPPPAMDQGVPAAAPGSEAEPPGAQPTPIFIQADPRLNAVIVQDIRERLPRYEQLIEQLDRPVGLIEISATLIDVDVDSGFQWGPPYMQQWRHSGDLFSLNFQLDPVDSANLSFTLLREGATRFMTAIRALETEGMAKLVSRPSVLTVDNMEARLDSTSTFFIRVAGDFETDLFNVNVGTNLRVIPHIIDTGDGRQVRLTVSVTDGDATGETVDEIPVIFENTVNTQAILRENESLLIGGLMREDEEVDKKRVPVLGRIPYIGPFFFTNTDIQKRRIERLVLITPRIITPGYEQTPKPTIPPGAEPSMHHPLHSLIQPMPPIHEQMPPPFCFDQPLGLTAPVLDEAPRFEEIPNSNSVLPTPMPQAAPPQIPPQPMPHPIPAQPSPQIPPQPNPAPNQPPVNQPPVNPPTPIRNQPIRQAPPINHPQPNPTINPPQPAPRQLNQPQSLLNLPPRMMPTSQMGEYIQIQPPSSRRQKEQFHLRRAGWQDPRTPPPVARPNYTVRQTTARPPSSHKRPYGAPAQQAPPQAEPGLLDGKTSNQDWLRRLPKINGGRP